MSECENSESHRERPSPADGRAGVEDSVVNVPSVDDIREAFERDAALREEVERLRAELAQARLGIPAPESACVVLEREEWEATKAEADRYREMLGQYESYAITVASALADREEVERLDAELAEAEQGHAAWRENYKTVLARCEKAEAELAAAKERIGGLEDVVDSLQSSCTCGCPGADHTSDEDGYYCEDDGHDCCEVSDAAARVFATETARAEKAESELAEERSRTDGLLCRVWSAIGNSALEPLEVWDAVACVREAVVVAEAELADVLTKDRIKTRELNGLVDEVRLLEADLAEAEQGHAAWRENYKTVLARCEKARADRLAGLIREWAEADAEWDRLYDTDAPCTPDDEPCPRCDELTRVNARRDRATAALLSAAKETE